MKIDLDDPDRFVQGLVDAFAKAKRSIENPQAKPVSPPGGPSGGPGEIDGLTPGECRERWEANAAAIESGMARPYALSPDQIAEGKRLHIAALKAGR